MKPSEPVQTPLSDVFETTKVGLNFGPMLKRIFDSSAGADLVRQVHIRFSDVTVVSAALLDLRDALGRQTCPGIAPLVDATITAVDGNQKPFFVISEVISGKRDARLTLADKAKADRVAQQIVNEQVKMEVSAEGVIKLNSDVVMPIGLKPVTVPKVVLVEQFGPVRGGEQVKLKWDPLDCGTPRACAPLFGPFADLVKEMKPKLDEVELAQ